MGKKEKLLELAKRSPSNYKFRDLLSLASQFGFEQKRQKGSHVLMAHSIYGLFVNFQDDSGRAKPYQVRQLLKMIEEYEL